MTTPDQRRFPRLSAPCPAELVDRFRSSQAVAEDVSARGCRLSVAPPPRPGALVTLVLRSALVDAPLRVAAQVVWVRDDRAGCSFVGALEGGPKPAEWVASLEAALARGPAPTPAREAAPTPPPLPASHRPAPRVLHVDAGEPRRVVPLARLRSAG